MRNFLYTTGFECKQALKRPLSWIAMVPLIALLVFNMNPYLFTELPMTDAETYYQQIADRKSIDGANFYNYALEMAVPMTDWEAYTYTLYHYCNFCATNYQMDAETIFNHIVGNRLSYEEDDWSAVNEYLYALVPEERREVFVPLSPDSFRQFSSSLFLNDYDAWVEYRDNTLLAAMDYTQWIGQHFGDLGGVVMLFYCFIVFTANFSQEVKKESYELLHSKRVRAGSYVISKWLGCGLAAVLMGLIPAAVIDALAIWHCCDLGIAWSLFGSWKYYFWWIVPSMMMVNAIISLCTLLCHSGIPSIPLLVFWMTGGAVSTKNAKGDSLYVQEFWNITVRTSNFDERLFSLLPPEFYDGIVLHKLFQLLVTIVCIALSILLYDKKKPLEKNRF